MERFFHETIQNWDDWGRMFQSIPAFSALAEEIYRRAGIPFSPLSPLTPGTNAVFRCGQTVVKIFFPKESGLDPLPDFTSETAVCGFLSARDVPTPRLLSHGHVDDKYRFFYILTEFCEGEEAGEYLSHAAPEEKISFARKVKKLTGKINVPAAGLLPEVDIKQRALENTRLKALPEKLQNDMRSRAAALDVSDRVLVHGDLTGENLLVDEAGDPVVIDCADACLAPAWYELGPIVFELFRCDGRMLKEFAGPDRAAFLERVLDAVCIHDFGAYLLREAARREGMPLFPDLAAVRNFLSGKLN